MNKLSLLLVSVPCFVACASQSGRYRVDVGPFFAHSTGVVALQNAGGSLELGQNQNAVDRDLGLGDTKASPYIRLQWENARHRVRLHGFAFSEEGQGTLAGDFGGLVAGSQVTTTMDYLSIAANWTYELLRGDHYRLGAGAQAGYYSLDIEARSTLGRESVETSVLVPMPFVEVEGLFDPFTLGANCSLMSADLGDANGRYLDAEGYVRFSPGKDFDFFAGYRYVVLDCFGRAGSRDFDADIDIQGFFFGAGIRF